MRAIAVTVLLVLVCTGLCGCQTSGEVENQAYVLVLGMDRLDDGQIELTARVPRIGKGQGQQGDAQSDDAYLTFSARGYAWSAAREALQWATPRQMNLSHIEMLVVSEALASNDTFPDLINQVTQTPHLYATARFVVCKGSAKAFVEAGETVIGTRMSAELKAMLRHYADEGFVPQSSLADVYYATDSIYSDPVAIHGYSLDELEADANSPARQRFSGAALFRDGRFVNALDIDQTRLLNLILGRSSALPVERDDACCELTPDGTPRVDLRWDGAPMQIKLSVRLSTLDAIPREALRLIEGELEAQILALIQNCQRLRVEPFGFAERAASRFLTVDDWLAFDWRTRFAEADVEVDVSVRQLVT